MCTGMKLYITIKNIDKKILWEKSAKIVQMTVFVQDKLWDLENILNCSQLKGLQIIHLF